MLGKLWGVSGKWLIYWEITVIQQTILTDDSFNGQKYKGRRDENAALPCLIEIKAYGIGVRNPMPMLYQPKNN